MKKLVFAISVALIGLVILSCNQTEKNKPQCDPKKSKSDSDLSKTKKDKTLNGIDATTAQSMITHFAMNKDNDKQPRATSIWFNKKTIHSIDSLLKGEKKADGLRIYFASDPSTIKPHLNNLIALFSTYSDPIQYPGNPNRSQHRDYYDHDASFLNSITGDITYDAKDPGALLYKSSPPCPVKDNNPCYFAPEHFITCHVANRWVRNYGKDKINSFSEWFELDLINQLDAGLQNVSNNLDGLRIYLAKANNSSSANNKNRCLFIIVPTTKDGNYHQDYYGCVEVKQLTDNGQLCPYNCN